MKKQIDKIREYFQALTVTPENIVLIANFPDTWILGITDGLLKDFKCEVRKTVQGVYFVDQFENGYDEIFRCINTIISINKEMEAKSALLKKKAKELSDLFLNTSLEELEGLEFNFNKKNSAKTQKKVTPKKEVVVDKKEQKSEEATSTSEAMVLETEQTLTTETTGNSLLDTLLPMNGQELTKFATENKI